jgi:hypothetical protein
MRKNFYLLVWFNVLFWILVVSARQILYRVVFVLFFDSRMLPSNICESLSLLECGVSVRQLNNGNWQACFARTVCLRIGPLRTGNRAGARVRSFDLANEARQMGEMAKRSHGARFAKTTANCSNSFCHFHLISSVSRPSTAFDLFCELILIHCHWGLWKHYTVYWLTDVSAK